MADLNRTPAAALRTPPLVFAGPSIPAEEVERLLPGAELRPPVRRGDLHLARMLRYSVFVLLDGVFAQNDAVSPREVVDVLKDGATVVGAASMGALRAVDCAPAGAIGTGQLFRLFRRGVVDSEDEVAVTFNPDAPFPALTLPLAGIRITLRRAVRKNLLSHDHADRLFDAAQDMHYSRRSWRTIFQRGLNAPCPPDLSAWLKTQDPKREDAQSALRYVARKLHRDPDWGTRPRTSRSPFPDHDALRMRAPALALGSYGRSPDAGLVLWLLVSGRANRWLDAPQCALSILREIGINPPQDWLTVPEKLTWQELGCDNIKRAETFAAFLIDRISHSGDIERECFRLKAVSGHMRGVRSGLVDAGVQRMIQNRIATAHGAADWQRLIDLASPDAAAMLKNLSQQLTAAKTSMATKISNYGLDYERNRRRENA